MTFLLKSIAEKSVALFSCTDVGIVGSRLIFFKDSVGLKCFVTKVKYIFCDSEIITKNALDYGILLISVLFSFHESYRQLIFTFTI